MKTLKIALAKGSLLPPAIAALAAAGFDIASLQNPGRQLKLKGAGGVEYIIARPADVPTYVEWGAVDIGFVGSDVLMEGQYQVYELLDLGFGRCKFVVAAKRVSAQPAGRQNAAQSPGCKADERRGEGAYAQLRDRAEAEDNAADGVFGRASMTIATKYPKVAGDYLAREGLQAEIVKLYGSLELAPLVGLADCIIDLMSTGRTIAENGLEVIDEIAEVSCRLIANRVSYKLKSSRINELVGRLSDKN